MPVEELSHETLLPSIKNKTAMTLWYADWCPHCKRYLASGALDSVAQRVEDAGDADKIAVYKFEGSTIPEHNHLAKKMFKDTDGAPKSIRSWPTFVLTHHSDGGPLQFEFVDPELPRDADSQYEALMDFHRAATKEEQPKPK